VGTSAYDSCVHCDGRAALLTVPGSRESYLQLFLLSLKVNVGWVSVMLLGAIWAGVYLAWALPAAGSGLMFALLLTFLWVLFFAVLHAAWKGSDRVGYSDATTRLKEDLLRPAWRLSLLCWLVVVGVWLLHRELRFLRRADEDPRAWVLVLALAVVIPVWVLGLARGDSLTSALSPARSVQLAWKLGRDYLLLAALSVVTCALMFFWLGAGTYMTQEGFGAFALPMNLFALYAVLLFARLTGLLMAARADRLGLAFRPDQRVPALPDVAPHGVRRPRLPVVPPRPRPAFVELDTEAPTGPMEVTGFTDLDPLDQALGTFAAKDDLAASEWSVPELVAIGQRAAARGRLSEAVRALKLAGSLRPEDPDAPRACVILARLYAERLEDAGSAEKLFRYVVQRYPATPAAQFAAAQLPAS